MRAKIPEETVNDPEIGLVITLLRRIRKWSQRTLSEAALLPLTTISDYEKGRKIPQLHTLEQIVTAMGYSLGAIDQTRAFIREFPPPA